MGLGNSSKRLLLETRIATTADTNNDGRSGNGRGQIVLKAASATKS